MWLDEWVIKPGDDIYLAIERGLEAARVQVLCLSPAALGSDWVALERSTVLFRDPTNAGRRFVPLLLADCTLPDTLRRYKYVDFRQETPAAFEELLAACREEAEAAPPAPQPEPKKKPAKRKPKPEKPPEQAEPLAVLERKLTGHKDWVSSVAVSPDGKWAASGSEDKTVKIWDLETGECRATLEGHTDKVRLRRDHAGWKADSVGVVSTIPFEFGMQSIGSGSWQSSMGHTRQASGSCVCVTTTITARFLVDTTRHSGCGNWHSGKCLKTIRDVALIKRSTSSAAPSMPAGTHALSGHRDGTVRLWNLETGECLATLKGHSDIVNSVQITPDGRFAVSGSDDKTVKVWDLEAGTCVGTLEGHQDIVHSVAISPDGTLIASTGFTDERFGSGIGNRGRACR